MSTWVKSDTLEQEELEVNREEILEEFGYGKDIFFYDFGDRRVGMCDIQQWSRLTPGRALGLISRR